MQNSENQQINLTKTISPERLQNIKDGADFLVLKLKDFLRIGLVNLANKQNEIINIYRRLVDYQAVGLANMVYKLTEIDNNFYNNNLKISIYISKLYLICQGIKNLENQTQDWQNQLLTIAGVSIPEKKILETTPINDYWFVLSYQRGQTNKLFYKKTWFIGKDSKKIVFYIQYLNNENQKEKIFTPGSYIKSEFYLYPGIESMRILFNETNETNENFAPNSIEGLENAIKNYNNIKIKNPFIDDIPIVLTNVFIIKRNDKFALADKNGFYIYLNNNKLETFKIFSIIGYNYFSCFVNINNLEAKIISVWFNNSYFFITDENA